MRHVFLICAAVLLAAFMPDSRLEPDTMPAVGTIYESASGNVLALVVDVDRPGDADAVFPEVVIHAMLTGSAGDIPHSPFALEVFADETVVGYTDDIPDEWQEGRAIWADAVAKGDAGVFTLSLDESYITIWQIIGDVEISD